MKCCSCGREIDDGVRFCTLCGAPQTAPVVEAVEEAVAVAAEETIAAPAAEVMEEPATEVVAEVSVAEAVEEESAAQIAEEVAEPVVFEPEAETVEEPVPAPAATANTVYQVVYQPTAAPEPKPAPVRATKGPLYKLPDRRGLGKMFFLGLITCGIYNMVIMSRIAEEMNMVASKHDGLRTQQFAWVSILSVLTLGIYPFVWIHGLCSRMGVELKRRGIDYKFGAGTFWLWGILGSLLIGIGPFIYTFKLCKASNLINRDYNING